VTAQSVTEPAVRVRGLEKSYKDLQVLRGVNLDVARGNILALLGSNGAGKTTVVKILSTLVTSDAGTASVNGFDVATQAAQARESFSPGSSPPSMRSSAAGRTSFSSPSCDT